MSYIREFPHPNIVIHYHPSRYQFSLDDVRFALSEGLHAIEVDLRLDRRAHQVVCSHERPTLHSPSLEQVIDLILTWKGTGATVHDDGRQFFLVLDPKDRSIDLFGGILIILRRHARHWSTAVSEVEPPRGITVLVSGKYRDQLHARFQADEVNRLCVVEGREYGHAIRNFSESQRPFQWVALRSGDERGRVNNLHAGTGVRFPGQHNVRVWDCNPTDLSRCLASGVDQINCDGDHVAGLKRMILDQSPCGRNPALAVQRKQALLTWRGPSSNDLYVALGTLEEEGLRFSRQLALTRFLADEPLTLAPTGALMPDGRLLIAYEAVSERRGVMLLWYRAIQRLPGRLARRLRRAQSLRYVSGRFSSLERFVTFDGGEHVLTSASGATLRGCNPALAVRPDGRVLIIYEGVAGRGLRYFTGTLNSGGELVGQAHDLIDGQVCLGASPAIAVDDAGRVVVVYQEPRKRRLACVSGSIGSSGRIAGRRFPLIPGSTCYGCAPSVAIDGNGRVMVAYEGNHSGELAYVSAVLDRSGFLDSDAFPVAEIGARHGKHPTVAYDREGGLTVLFETPADHRLRYVRVVLRSGRFAGEEKALRIGMERH